jgi:acid stress-induced BolA-like protein IbaG/YrbA
MFAKKSDWIKQKMAKSMPAASIVVLTEDEHHFEILVISEVFEGLSRLKRQQYVYGILNEAIVSGDLHALTLKTMTPAEQKAQHGAGQHHGCCDGDHTHG